MRRHEHLLTILGEEAVEVAQRCSKALRFGLEEVQPAIDSGLADPGGSIRRHCRATLLDFPPPKRARLLQIVAARLYGDRGLEDVVEFADWVKDGLRVELS